MRLAAAGEVDTKATAAAWAMLTGPVLEEAVRAMLGRMGATAAELVAAEGCEDGSAIKSILQLGEGGQPCHLCQGAHDSRTHWRYQCPAATAALVQVSLEAAGRLAVAGNALWFEPGRRVPYADHTLPEYGKMQAPPGVEESKQRPSCLIVATGGQKHTLTKERAECLATAWSDRDDTDNFAQAAIAAVQEATERSSAGLAIVAQIPVELRAWIRDALHMQQEALTSALTFSTAFRSPPGVVGAAWDQTAGEREWTADSDHPSSSDAQNAQWRRSPWGSNTLIVVDEHRDQALTSVWDKVRATARAGQCVMVVMQEAKPRSRIDYYNMGASELAFFPSGTLAFGHAAGWNDDTLEGKPGSHAWTRSKYGAIAPPRHQPGVLPRHPGMMNRRDVRWLLFGPGPLRSELAKGVSVDSCAAWHCWSQAPGATGTARRSDGRQRGTAIKSCPRHSRGARSSHRPATTSSDRGT